MLKRFSLIFVLLFLFWAPGASADTIRFPVELNFSEYKGQTYLSFMSKVVKPALDEKATKGYKVLGGDAMERAYDLSDRKVQRKVDGRFGGLSKVKRIANKLAGQTVNLNTLPGKIGSIDGGVDRYGLSTFIGLASGGGVSIKYHAQNYGPWNGVQSLFTPL